jgi:hypothetical protein
MCAFSSDMQHIWHIYWSRTQNSETRIKILILISSAFLGPLKKDGFYEFPPLAEP